MYGHARCCRGYIGLANALGNVTAIEQHSVSFAVGFEPDHGILRQLSQRLAVVQRHLLLHRPERQRAIHGAALEIDVAKLLGQAGGDCALARSRGAVNGDNQLSACAHSLPVSSLGASGFDRAAGLRGRRSTNGIPGRGGSGSKRGFGFNSPCAASGCSSCSDETCSMTRPATCTYVSSRAACSAWIPSRTRARPMIFEKNCSTSSCCAASTQSRYFETNAVSDSANETCMPCFTAWGDQRKSTSQKTPSSCL